MTFDPGISEWGNPVRATALPRKRGEPGELKHLSSRRKRKQNVNPLVEAIEEGRAQTGCVTAPPGFGPEETGRRRAEQRMERRGDKGDSPVSVRIPSQGASRVTRGTRNPVRTRQDHLPRLNTT